MSSGFFDSALSWLLLLFISIAAASCILKTKKKSVISRDKLPPSPPKLPIMGNLHQLRKLPHQKLWKLSQKYGPAMLLQLGNIPTLVISSAQMAKQIMKTHDTSFCSRPPSPGAKRIFYNFLDLAFTPYGDHWLRMRKIFVSQLLNSRTNPSFLHAREVEIGHLIDYLSAASPNPVNLDEKMFNLVGGVIDKVAFGKRRRGKKFQGQELKDVLDEVMDVLNGFSAEDFFPFLGRIIDSVTGHRARLNKCFQKLDSYLEMVLDEHLNQEMQNGEDEDLVDVLIRLSKDNSGVYLSKEHIKALLMNIFLGGVDTTAITLVWAMSELMKNPRVMQKVQEEIRSNLGMKQKVDSDDLKKLIYLKMVMKETLRLHPAVPLLIPRQCMQHCKISDGNNVYDIYPKTKVLINAWAIGRDPNSWKNPNEFLPERFEESEIDFRGQHFELVAFGAGRRLCPGISTSIATIEFTLANLLYWFDWQLPNGLKMDLEEEGGITVHKRTTLNLLPIKHAFNVYPCEHVLSFSP
ncbi:Cytochrome [Forsythia ovata]|uniref:Cytochrome n=1 Tax=Forsythia ovata TaxID=205694 RepID=A0ABD1UA57_9LAMI